MGWEEDLFALFDDLEQQAEALFDGERAPELADRSRAEYQQVTLASRLMASVADDVTLDVRGVGPVAGRLDRVATGWCLVGTVPGQDWVVALARSPRVRGASERSVPEVAWSPLTRLALGSALRRLADSGERCVLHLRRRQPPRRRAAPGRSRLRRARRLRWAAGAGAVRWAGGGPEPGGLRSRAGSRVPGPPGIPHLIVLCRGRTGRGSQDLLGFPT